MRDGGFSVPSGDMTIGSSIFLIVLGAVLAFGLRTEIPFVDAQVVGYVLMVAGAIGLVLGPFLYLQRSRPRGSSTTSVVQDPYGHETVRRTENRVDGPGPAGPGTPL
jgi:hypothetical protein